MLYILLPLSITLLIEPIVFSLIKDFNLKIFITSSLVNIATNVTMNLFYVFVFSFNETFLILFEIFAVIFEGFLISIICEEKITKSLLFSLLANTASFLAGITINSMLVPEQIITIIAFGLYLVFLALTVLYYFSNEKNDKSN